jgi:hypothetical protein
MVADWTGRYMPSSTARKMAQTTAIEARTNLFGGEFADCAAPETLRILRSNSSVPCSSKIEHQHQLGLSAVLGTGTARQCGLTSHFAPDQPRAIILHNATVAPKDLMFR